MNKQTRMTVEQYVELTNWLRQHKFRIRKEKLIQVKVCDQASSVPIERGAIMILIGAICGLYIETGRTIPHTLADLKSSYARESAQKQKHLSESNAGLEKYIENPDIEIEKHEF